MTNYHQLQQLLRTMQSSRSALAHDLTKDVPGDWQPVSIVDAIAKKLRCPGRRRARRYSNSSQWSNSTLIGDYAKHC